VKSYGCFYIQRDLRNIQRQVISMNFQPSSLILYKKRDPYTIMHLPF